LEKETVESRPLLKGGATLLYHYLRGSQAYHLNTPESDIDSMYVYINPLDTLLGLRDKNDEYSADRKGDNVGYDIEKFLGLIVKSNPTVLESLFIDNDCVLSSSPEMEEIRSHRDEFLTKDCLRAFLGYAYEQISKAKGYNKLCAYPENMERKTPIDFCYTFNDKQGTELIEKWLSRHGLKQKYCGLNHMPNMVMMHGVFYDWGEHLHLEFKNWEEAYEDYKSRKDNGHEWFWDKIYEICNKTFTDITNPNHYKWFCGGNSFKIAYESLVPKGYHGIVKEDGSSCEIRLDSILKGDTPICCLSYNKNGFESHCALYKNWKNWKEVRNEARYKSNFGTGFDAKNMMHCIRLLRMAVEVAEGRGFNLNRETAGDREYLLDIKAHKHTYEEIMEEANCLKSKLETLIKECDLPEHVDSNMVNDLLIKIRRKHYSL